MSNSTEAEIRRAQAEASLDRLAALIRFAASWAVTGMGCAISLGATFALVLGGGDATRGLIALVFGLALVLVGIRIAPRLHAWFLASRNRTIVIGMLPVLVVVVGPMVGNVLRAIF